MKKSKFILLIVLASVLSACVQINTAPQPTTTTSVAQTIQSNQTTTSKASKQSATSGAQTSTQNPVSSYKEAMEKLSEEFFSQYGSLDITKVQLKSAQQPTVYEVSAMDNTTEYEYIYQADSQTFVQTEMDRKKGNIAYKREYEKVDASKLSDVDEIISIAMGQFSGGQLKDWQIERDNGQLIWKVEIHHNGHSMEVIIDANTKGILKIDD